MVLKLFTTFIVVAAILASPKHRDFTWSYRSSIYRVHWFIFKQIELVDKRDEYRYTHITVINKLSRKTDEMILVT